ncbi:phage distal tail protein [Arthrobacter sp. PsM3]|uniref:phage distal tail protein n=1 Tax=Arthrobacter sp. PsM3 TaxID=3030531 RepID=UPI00263A4181|nr:hypothetical protein [Arthrobacter sp. PsM3]MDN4646465.1 hypothetical protein [Arthrobacter sp. PsM3]
MPFPSPLTYPSGLLNPGAGGSSFPPIAVGDLVMNTVDASGVQWVLSDLQGWGSPGSTAQATPRARGRGSTMSEAFLKHRTLVGTGSILTEDPALLTAAIDQLIAAIDLEPFQITVAEPGLIRSISVQRQDDVLPKKLNAYEADFSFQVVAKDPLKYGDLITKTTKLPYSSGGLIRPSSWPRTWSGVSGAGVISIDNTGKTNSPVWLRIDGPVPAGGWTVTHLGKKTTLSFATALALGAGEFVTVDMDRREVLAQGQAPRSGYVTSRGWFDLDPGVNEIAFSANNYSSTALLTVSTKPAWS